MKKYRIPDAAAELRPITGGRYICKRVGAECAIVHEVVEHCLKRRVYRYVIADGPTWSLAWTRFVAVANAEKQRLAALRQPAPAKEEGK